MGTREGERKGKEVRNGRRSRDDRMGRREGRVGEEKGNLAPRLFLEVGAYVGSYSTCAVSDVQITACHRLKTSRQAVSQTDMKYWQRCCIWL